MEEADKTPETNSGAIKHQNPQHLSRERNYIAYKLIVDPVLVKGALKLYRFDGVTPGYSSYSNIIVRDPRKKKNESRPDDPMILPVPAFQIDANYVGEIPPTEVTFTNLNDNVSQLHLHALCTKFGLVENVQIFRHPISHRHLGLGHAIFQTSRDARTCIGKLNGTLVMGQKANIFFDPSGQKFKELFIAATTQLPGSTKDDGRKVGGSIYSAANTVTSTSRTASSYGKPRQQPKSLSSTPLSACKQRDVDDEHRFHFGLDHQYKKDNGHTPHYDQETIISDASNDKIPSTKISSSRSRDKERHRNGEHKRRHNSSYENSNNEYPIQSETGSARSTPSVSYPGGYHQSQSHPRQRSLHPVSSPSPQSSTRNKSGDYHLQAIASDTEYVELSPRKLDLDTRIKMMLKGPNSEQFAKYFADSNISASGSETESDTERSPLKRVRLNLSSAASAKIWESESDEDGSNEASFAKKFKHSFVPVTSDGTQVSSSRQSSRPKTFQRLQKIRSSPPPSPFLSRKARSAVKSLREQVCPEIDRMSLSLLSPDDGTGSRERNRVSRFNSVPQPLQQEQNHWTPSLSCSPPTDKFMAKHMKIEKPLPHLRTPPKEDHHKNAELLNKALIELMVEDLKQVLTRDCNRRFVETEAFKMYESWWDQQETNFRRKLEEENAKNLLPSTSQSAAPEVIIDDSSGGGAGAVVIAPCGMNAGLGIGLGLLHAIPKLPSFRKNIETQKPVHEEDSRKSFFDSDSDSASTSEDDEDIIGRKKSKPKLLTTTDDESEGSCSESSKSSTQEEKYQNITDVEIISTTEDEDDFTSEKMETQQVEKQQSPMEVEDILSDENLPGDFARTPEHDKKQCLETHCHTASPIKRKLFDERTTSASEDEVEEGEIEEKVSPLRINKRGDTMFVSKASTSNFAEFKSVDPHTETEKPLIIPYDVTQPRGYKKTKTSKDQSFHLREEQERLEIVNEFLQEGIDAEDIRFFRTAYDNLLQDNTFCWINSTHWVDHPETAIEKKMPQQKGSENNEFNEEWGSLRTRGFKRLSKDEKSGGILGPQLSLGTTWQSRIADMGKIRDNISREARSNQRRLLTVLGSDSDLLKFNQLHFRKKALTFARSGIHGWGLFAAEPIAADEMVIEYVGQLVRPIIADLREIKYQEQGICSSYLFKIDETIIDATKCGNLARFINHSCNPNCYAKEITIEGENKMVIYSKQPIAVSEEITYDYKFPIEEKKIPCVCGTPQCRGSLN